ncbi:MAG: sigma-70 family RNA polymerase sigma factor [Phycisphaerae bacterium]
MANAIAVAAERYQAPAPSAACDEDAQLMLAFQQGEDLAFQKLVEHNHARVIGLVYRFIGNSTEAEDLAQEVFVRIYRARATYRPTAKFSTWMFRIAANVGLNALRDRAHRRDDVSIEQLAGADRGPYTIPDPEVRGPASEMDRSELRTRIQDAIRELPEKQQLAVVLSKYEGLAYTDIARTMGCSTMAVKSLLARARESLKERLLLYLRTGRRPQRVRS